MDMPQSRADENQYFIAREDVERDDSTTGAVSDLIRGVSESSFARNAFQQFGYPVTRNTNPPVRNELSSCGIPVGYEVCVRYLGGGMGRSTTLKMSVVRLDGGCRS